MKSCMISTKSNTIIRNGRKCMVSLKVFLLRKQKRLIWFSSVIRSDDTSEATSYQEISKRINLWNRKYWIVNSSGKGSPWYLNEHYDPRRLMAKSSFCCRTTSLTLFADRFIQSIIKRCQWYWKTNAKLTLSEKYQFNVESDILAFCY